MVVDEIENALSYYRTTFLQGIPSLMAEMEEDIAEVFPRRWRRSCRWVRGSAATATAIRT